MKTFPFFLVTYLFTYILTANGAALSQPNLDPYNIVWTSQSKDSSESMPVGGYDTGLNVWVENGDILFYAQKSGCFSENNEYFKLGRVRIKLDPNPFTADAEFRQELKLQEGYVEITGSSELVEATVKIWAEAQRPVIHVDVEADKPVKMTTAYEGWRNEDIELSENDGPMRRFGCFSYERYPGKVYKYKDAVDFEGDSVLVYHRNRDDKLLFDLLVTKQGLEGHKDELVNTQKGRTFGGMLIGDGFVAAGTSEGTYIKTDYKAWNIQSNQARKSHSVKLYSHLDQTKTLAQWRSGLDKLVSAKNPSDAGAFKKTKAWWKEFWERSFMVVNSDDMDSKAWQLGRNYQLFRYMLGCNAYGTYPTKFNGGNFTYDPFLIKSHSLGISQFLPVPYTPDWRTWGGGSFTAQNQRLLYWPMLRSGDFDMMVPQFDFYNRVLPNATARVQEYWGHKGCAYAEQLENLGLPLLLTGGWENYDAECNKINKDDDGSKNEIKDEFKDHSCLGQLEFGYMILEYHRYCGIDISEYMDFIKSAVIYFDEHYQKRYQVSHGQPLDENGKLVIYPTAAAESYREAKNPITIVAGLKACVKGLLDLPEKYVSAKEKDYFKGLLDRIPGYDYEVINGDNTVKAAWSWGSAAPDEAPHFYPLFPFNEYALGKDDMTIWRDTWKQGNFWKNVVVSWHQDGIFYARMGMTEDAKKYNTRKMEDCPRRFPTFWGPGNDWTPDHNWGGSGMIGIQEMLMQTIGDRIYLLPAWPKDWDVDFKLHAPKQTVVQGRVRNGKIEDLKVTPTSRLKDVYYLTVQDEKVNGKDGQRNRQISMDAVQGQDIVYWFDSLEPTEKPQKYTKPFIFDRAGVIFVQCRSKDGDKSRPVQFSYDQFFDLIEVNKKDWKVVSFDSQQPGEGYATHAIDGKPETYWHTNWQTTKEPMPHEIQIDLGDTYNLVGLRYLARQDMANGRIKDYELSLSLDGKQFQQVQKGSFSNNTNWQQVLFAEKKKARFIKVKALNEHEGNYYTTIAELDCMAIE